MLNIFRYYVIMGWTDSNSDLMIVLDEKSRHHKVLPVHPEVNTCITWTSSERLLEMNSRSLL